MALIQSQSCAPMHTYHCSSNSSFTLHYSLQMEADYTYPILKFKDHFWIRTRVSRPRARRIMPIILNNPCGPDNGFEPLTCALQERCSTPELIRLSLIYLGSNQGHRAVSQVCSITPYINYELLRRIERRSSVYKTEVIAIIR